MSDFDDALESAMKQPGRIIGFTDDPDGGADLGVCAVVAPDVLLACGGADVIPSSRFRELPEDHALHGDDGRGWYVELQGAPNVHFIARCDEEDGRSFVEYIAGLLRAALPAPEPDPVAENVTRLERGIKPLAAEAEKVVAKAGRGRKAKDAETVEPDTYDDGRPRSPAADAIAGWH